MARTRPRMRWVATAAALGLLAGLGSAALIPADTAELDAANHDLGSSAQRIEQLESDLSAMTAENAELNRRIDEADADAAEAADAAAAATAHEDRLDAREARLDKRAKSLDQREKSLADFNTADTTPDGGETENVATSSEFDRPYAMDIATDIIEDITTVDERLGDGIGASSALSLLSDSYGRLLDAGMPPGTGSEYYGRVTTLQTFAEDAANLYDVNAMEGTAKYAVIRKQTGVLFGQLNDALNTAFRLPPP